MSFEIPMLQQTKDEFAYFVPGTTLGFWATLADA
jgi:hypothetical protein